MALKIDPTLDRAYESIVDLLKLKMFKVADDLLAEAIDNGLYEFNFAQQDRRFD